MDHKKKKHSKKKIFAGVIAALVVAMAIERSRGDKSFVKKGGTAMFNKIKHLLPANTKTKLEKNPGMVATAIEEAKIIENEEHKSIQEIVTTSQNTTEATKIVEENMVNNNTPAVEAVAAAAAVKSPKITSNIQAFINDPDYHAKIKNKNKKYMENRINFKNPNSKSEFHLKAAKMMSRHKQNEEDAKIAKEFNKAAKQKYFDIAKTVAADHGSIAASARKNAIAEARKNAIADVAREAWHSFGRRRKSKKSKRSRRHRKSKRSNRKRSNRKRSKKMRKRRSRK